MRREEGFIPGLSVATPTVTPGRLTRINCHKNRKPKIQTLGVKEINCGRSFSPGAVPWFRFPIAYFNTVPGDDGTSGISLAARERDQATATL